ncbi:MAG: nickel pincer cofactor biosynthesis protein LarB [Verrucomicrobia bacterium]|nr:MAG: nickel pincer cofactor biosynthesis protein LarB [Verrucomicrobiota bacterium]
MDWKQILKDLADGRMSEEEAARRLWSLLELRTSAADLDVDRLRRRGVPEVVFCQGKSPGQVEEIVGTLLASGQPVLATRVSEEQAARLAKRFPKLEYHPDARIVRSPVGRQLRGRVCVVSAGTADLPVSEEAALTAEFLGARVERVYDVGVAGLHRVMRFVPLFRRSRALVVVAGMEGALPSVVGGLVDRPVIAVPTSVGYGASLQGLAALLGMLNSCVAGVTVVNIDNGFGAGVAAAMINRLPDQEGRE